MDRNDLIHLRNILEDRINEQYDLFLELTDAPNDSCIENVVETLVVSIKKNVNILNKLSHTVRLMGCDPQPLYNSQWLEAVYAHKEEWLQTNRSSKRSLRTLCARYIGGSKNLIGGR